MYFLRPFHFVKSIEAFSLIIPDATTITDDLILQEISTQIDHLGCFVSSEPHRECVTLVCNRICLLFQATSFQVCVKTLPCEAKTWWDVTDSASPCWLLRHAALRGKRHNLVWHAHTRFKRSMRTYTHAFTHLLHLLHTETDHKIESSFSSRWRRENKKTPPRSCRKQQVWRHNTITIYTLLTVV